MALEIRDRVWETSISQGTADFTLAGAFASGYRTFGSSYTTGSTNTFPYVIENPTNGQWEVGISYLSSGTVLKRAGSQTVIASSNSNNAVNFSAGTKNVFVDATTGFLARMARYDMGGAFGAMQYVVPSVVTNPAASTTWNWMVQQTFHVTLNKNVDINSITNANAGATAVCVVKQPASGTPYSFGVSAAIWAGGVAPVNTQVLGAIDVYTFYSDGTNVYGALQKDFK